MRTLYRILAILVLLFLLPGPLQATAVQRGDSLKTFIAKDMNGKAVDLGDMIGKKPIMLIFWASWCSDCTRVVSEVNDLVKKFHSRGLEFLGVNVGYNDSEDRARHFMDRTGMAYPAIFDDDETITNRYGIQGVPTILITNRDGTVVFKGYGVPNITDEIFKRLNQ